MIIYFRPPPLYRLGTGTVRIQTMAEFLEEECGPEVKYLHYLDDTNSLFAISYIKS